MLAVQDGKPWIMSWTEMGRWLCRHVLHTCKHLCGHENLAGSTAGANQKAWLIGQMVFVHARKFFLLSNVSYLAGPGKEVHASNANSFTEGRSKMCM